MASREVKDGTLDGKGEDAGFADKDESVAARSSADYDAQVEEFFKLHYDFILRCFFKAARDQGASRADAMDMCQDYILSILERRELDFSRNPEWYVVKGVNRAVYFRMMSDIRGSTKRRVGETALACRLIDNAVLDPRVSSEQEGRHVGAEVAENFKTAIGRIFKRMPFRAACTFFLYCICRCSLGFVGGLFNNVPGSMHGHFESSCSDFADQVMELKQGDVNDFSLADVSMVDDSVIDMIRGVLLERANFRKEHREGTAVDYPLLRDLLGRPFGEFMGVVESVKAERAHYVNFARGSVGKALKDALAG